MKSPTHNLVLFTNHYPFGLGETFLETEIRYLAQAFGRVIIVPSKCFGEARSVPANVVIETSYAKSRPKATIGRVVTSLAQYPNYLLHDFARYKTAFKQVTSLRKAVSFLNEARSVRDWTKMYIAASRLDPRTTLFYSYWLSPSCLGIGMLKYDIPIRIVSRAHRGDLYEDRFSPPYIPYRYPIFRSLNLLFLISQHGYDYIRQKYPSVNLRCEVSRLGVTDPGFVNHGSQDATFRLLSCSFLLPVKRLTLLIEALSYLVVEHPELNLEWNHLGDGPQRAELEAQARNYLPPNISWRFHGQLTNSDIFAYYAANPVDVFINVSESEGIAVSIMEAQSCGIPVIATSVGGIPEIVTSENGYLLDSNPSPHQVAGAIYSAIKNNTEWLQKRQRSRETWRTMYNADINYRQFADRLIQLLDEGV